MYYDLDKAIKVTSFGRVHQPHGFWHSGRSLNRNLFLYLSDGTLRLKSGGVIYDMSAGDILIIPKDTRYTPLESSGCSYFFVHFRADEGIPSQNRLIIDRHNLPEGDFGCNYITEDFNCINIEEYIPSAGAVVKDLLEKMAALDISRNKYEYLTLLCLFRQLLISLCTELSDSPARSKALGIMTEYIDRHLTSDLSLSVLACAAGVSKSYAARQFRQELGMSSSDYVNRVRISAACDLLINTSVSIAGIAERVGYKNQYYFSRVFSAVKGISPIVFRNSR